MAVTDRVALPLCASIVDPIQPPAIPTLLESSFNSLALFCRNTYDVGRDSAPSLRAPALTRKWGDSLGCSWSCERTCAPIFVCLLLVYPSSCEPGPLSCHAWHLSGPALFAHVYCLPLWCQIPTWKWNWRPPTLFQYGILGTKSTNYGAKGFQPHARGRSIPSTPLPRWLSTAADTLVSL